MALASERPYWNVTAIEKNLQAIKVAKQNIENYKLKNIQLLSANWATALKAECMDIVVSNPPYIVSNDLHLTQGDVAHEPKYALVANQNGLEDITFIADQSQYALKKYGWLLIEHGYNQAKSVRKIMKDNRFVNIATALDLELQDRVTIGQKS